MKAIQLAIIGNGLLGASLGMAIRGNIYRRAIWSRRKEARAWALLNDVADRADDSLAATLAEADLVVLAMPIPGIIEFLNNSGKLLKPDAVVTDVGSTKKSIMEAAAANKINFVGSHPMAGTEKSGNLAAFPSLYADADVFLCRGEADDRAFEMVKKMWIAAGANLPIEIAPDIHDNTVAHTSHVLHIIASSLALAILQGADPEEKMRRFAGCATGFRDTSRIASSNPVMWREIIESNREEVLAAMAQFENEYGQFKHLIEQGNFDEFEDKFRCGKELRDAWIEYKQWKTSE